MTEAVSNMVQSFKLDFGNDSLSLLSLVAVEENGKIVPNYNSAMPELNIGEDNNVSDEFLTEQFCKLPK